MLLDKIMTLTQQVNNHESVIKESGMYDVATINNMVRVYEEKDPPLAIYFRTFYWSLNNYLKAYSIADTGMF